MSGRRVAPPGTPKPPAKRGAWQCPCCGRRTLGPRTRCGDCALACKLVDGAWQSGPYCPGNEEPAARRVPPPGARTGRKPTDAQRFTIAPERFAPASSRVPPAIAPGTDDPARSGREPVRHVAGAVARVMRDPWSRS